VGKLAGTGGFDFALVFAQFGWNPSEAESLVEFFFGGDGSELFAFFDAVFREGEAFGEGEFAQSNVVGFGAGEVLQ